MAFYDDNVIEATSLQDDEDDKHSDWELKIAFNSSRHTEVIEGVDCITQTWRMKERMKTVSVALVVCLNVGVDPPDIVKTRPCARLECWIDPHAMCAFRSLEAVGNALQKQYERWQPRARYKQSLDPTVEEVKKLCTSLRRNAKEERVLFHYNGHGVPRPTANGEIWVFNKYYTQYIPLSVYDLQTYMGAPSIYVYDCSHAGIIVENFKQFAEQHDKDELQVHGCSSSMSGATPNYKNCIQLAACAADEILPMHPDLPADIFTSCLTTPIKMALRWSVLQNSSRLVPRITLDLIDKIPGQLSDRRTMLGELNWIFTAITDTIAWNTLPRELFQKLFRQDLLVASLFRNYLLADRIMHCYNCTPVSSPQLPPTHLHPMWSAWDVALDQSLANLPAVIECEDNFRHSGFFQDQLTAFQVSLSQPISYGPPTQLPIVLQVLLSQVHRLRALELLGKFLDLGPKAVNLALSVGIFPYVLKLLQSSAKELRPLLVFIWAKILAVDKSCQGDLVRDDGHKYFISILKDSTMSSNERMLSTFVLACIVDKHEAGQEAALKGSLISICLEQLQDAEPKLRQWLAICLGRLWRNYDQARWTGVRDQAHEKLYHLLKDPIPEVRASAVFALGTFINSATVRSEHANSIDRGVALTLLNIVGKDMSPLVRQELVVALQNMVIVFENSFLSAAFLDMKEGNQVALVSGVLHSPVSTLRRNASKDRLSKLGNNIDVDSSGNRNSLVRVPSSSSISNLGNSAGIANIQFGSVYHKMWLGLTALDDDPYPSVASMARKITDHIRLQLCAWPGQTSPLKDQGPWSASVHMGHLSAKESIVSRDNENKSSSLPPSPSNRSGYLIMSESPPKTLNVDSTDKLSAKLNNKTTKRSAIKTINEDIAEENNNSQRRLVSTQFVEWSCKYFAEPVVTDNLVTDDESITYSQRQWRYKRNWRLRTEAKEEISRLCSGQYLEHCIFTTRVSSPPHYLLLHPYEPHIAIAYKDSFMLRDYSSMNKVTNVKCCNRTCRVTCLDYINAHDISLIASVCDDASVRVYNQTGTLVTSWQALHSTPKSNNSYGCGTVMKWDQFRTELLVAGEKESRIIRCWDAEKEMSVADIATGCNDPVTCLAIDPSGGALMAAGCGDGSVRLFDRRLPAQDCKTLTYRDLAGRLLDVSIHMSSDIVICASTGGDVRLCDTRNNHSKLACQTSLGMKAMAVHSSAGIFACGASDQISIYNLNGAAANVIRASHDQWFSNSKFGPVSCLAFHPYRVLLAAGSNDSSVAIYSIDPKR